MSTKKSKKLRKYVRKEFKDNFGSGIKVLSTITRKRPKSIPKFLWVILYLPLFKLKYIKVIYKYID